MHKKIDQQLYNYIIYMSYKQAGFREKHENQQYQRDTGRFIYRNWPKLAETGRNWTKLNETDRNWPEMIWNKILFKS